MKMIDVVLMMMVVCFVMVGMVPAAKFEDLKVVIDESNFCGETNYLDLRKLMLGTRRERISAQASSPLRRRPIERIIFLLFGKICLDDKD